MSRLTVNWRQCVRGFGIGCAGLFFLLQSVRFFSYERVLLLLAAAALLGLHRIGHKLLTIAAAVLAVASAAIAFTPLMDWSFHFLDKTVQPHKADAIVILGAGMYCGTGDLDSASLARITKGLALWKSGFSRVITVSDADRSITGPNCKPQGAVTTAFIRSLYGDIGPTTIVLPNMRTTRTEAAEVARLAKQRGWQSVMVVTSPTHSRRSLDTFRRAGVNAFVVAATEPQFDRTFSHPADRINSFGHVLREFAGMIKYKLT
jgi:uncharacterized SAM-binding protein YcdF (DUF218 family)